MTSWTALSDIVRQIRKADGAKADVFTARLKDLESLSRSGASEHVMSLIELVTMHCKCKTTEKATWESLQVRVDDALIADVGPRPNASDPAYQDLLLAYNDLCEAYNCTCSSISDMWREINWLKCQVIQPKNPGFPNSMAEDLLYEPESYGRGLPVDPPIDSAVKTQEPREHPIASTSAKSSYAKITQASVLPLEQPKGPKAIFAMAQLKKLQPREQLKLQQLLSQKMREFSSSDGPKIDFSKLGQGISGNFNALYDSIDRAHTLEEFRAAVAPIAQ
jgi:hypothetical protein